MPTSCSTCPIPSPVTRLSAPGSSYWRIQPGTSLPAFVGAGTVVDATSQTTFAIAQGYDLNAQGPEVELDGSVALGNAIEITGSNSEVRGLVINGAVTGVAVLGGDGTVIAGNVIGPDASGAVGEVGNSSQGITDLWSDQHRHRRGHRPPIGT